MDSDAIVERLRRGGSVALVVDDGHGVVEAIERELRTLGRTTLWIDLAGAESGAELAARIVEGCIPALDHDELGDLLERLPSRGRLDLEAFAELLMLPETVAARQGRRVVVILDGFEAIERTTGFPGLAALRDALMLRDQVGYLFVGGRRLAALFGQPRMPLFGLAEVVEVETTAAPAHNRRRTPRPSQRVPGTGPVEPSDESGDPLAAALLNWAQPPPPPEPPRRSPAEEAWERLLAREAEMRRLLELEEEEDEPWRRRRRPRRGWR